MQLLRVLLISLLFSPFSLCGQVSIQIRIKQAITKKVTLYYYHSESVVPIDSAFQISPGMFRFNLPPKHKQGVYKLALGNNISFDFIVTSEPEISIETVVYAADDSLKSIISKENEVYFNYKKYKKSRSQQQWFLNSLKDYYSDTSSFGNIINAERSRIKNDISNFASKIAQENPNLFASTLIKTEQTPIPPATLNAIDKQVFLIQNWWHNVNLNDARLINIPGFERKLWGFMELYFDEKLDKEQQDSAIIEGVKTLMNLNTDSTIKNYFRNTLYSDFIETDYYNTSIFLEKFHIDGIPDLAPSENKFSKIIVGSKAYDFKVEANNSNKVKLSKIVSNYKLVIFWSRWCPHCTEMLPELNKIYQNYKDKGFETIAVSIDNEVKDWKSFIEENKLNWINMLEPDDGKSTILSKYYVEETPMLFLLDKDLNIISRPSNAKQLEVKLKRILR